MTTYKDWSIFFVVAALLASSLASSTDGVFTYRLHPSTIQPGQRATLTVSLKIPGLSEKEVEEIQMQDQFLVEGKDWVLLQNSKNVEGDELIWRYQVSAYRPGSLRLPPLEISQRTSSYSTEAVELKIQSTRPDGDMQIREGFGMLTLPVRWGRWAYRIGTSLLLLAALVLVLRWVTKKLKKRPAPVVAAPVFLPPPEDPNVWLRRHLDMYRERAQREGGDPFLIDDFVSLIREYFSRSSIKNARALTTLELRLKSMQSPALAHMLPYMERCDSFRFQQKHADPQKLALECVEGAEKGILACI